MIRGMAALALTMVTGVPVAEETITTLFGMRRYAVNAMLLVVGQPVKDRGDENG